MPVRTWFGFANGNAPRLAGLAVFTALALSVTSCGKTSGTPDWDHAETEPAAIEEPSSKAPESIPLQEAQVPPAAGQPLGSPDGLRFIAYNVENWLTMDRFVDNKQLKNSPKPESEKESVIKLLATNKPDVIGLCEIGEAKDLAEIQESLKAAGLDQAVGLDRTVHRDRAFFDPAG